MTLVSKVKDKERRLNHPGNTSREVLNRKRRIEQNISTGVRGKTLYIKNIPIVRIAVGVGSSEGN